MARVVDTEANAAPPAAPGATAPGAFWGPSGGTSGYWSRDPRTGLIQWVQSAGTPATGGHWEQWFRNPDGSWTQTQSDQNAASGWGVWVPDTGASGTSTGRDWSTDLGIPGLPADVANTVNQIFAQTPDVNEATRLAMAFIRGTPWYATTYPGINYGINKGLFQDERGYRDYLNQLNQVYRQYYGRDVSGEEMAGFLNEGVTPTVVGQRAQGDVIAKTNAPEWSYVSGAFDTGRLSGAEAQAAGREQAGIDTPLGQAVMRRLQQAQARMQAAFGGQVGTPTFGLGPAGLSSPSLARRGGSDVAA